MDKHNLLKIIFTLILSPTISFADSCHPAVDIKFEGGILCSIFEGYKPIPPQGWQARDIVGYSMDSEGHKYQSKCDSNVAHNTGFELIKTIVYFKKNIVTCQYKHPKHDEIHLEKEVFITPQTIDRLKNNDHWFIKDDIATCYKKECEW